MMNFCERLDIILEEEYNDNFKSAVAIVQDGDRWLLGLSTSDDDRNMKWVHPGGHIEKDETPEDAATREAWEETGVKCKAIGEPFSLPNHKGVAFVHCKALSKNLDNNDEFSALGFFTIDELSGLKLYKNAKQLINRVK